MQYLPTIFTAASIGLKAAGQYRQGDFAEQAAEYNARVLEQEAAYQKEKAAIDESRLRREGQSAMGRERAIYGASGVRLDAGTPVDALVDMADDIDRQADVIRWEGDVASRRYLNRAAWERYQGRQRKSASRLDLGSTLLTAPLRWLSLS